MLCFIHDLFFCPLKEGGGPLVALSPFPERPTVSEGQRGWHVETLTPFWEPLQHLLVSIIRNLGVWSSEDPGMQGRKTRMCLLTY